MVKGESNINSGELVNSWGSKSAVTDLLVVAGDATEATAGLSAAIDEVGFEADSEPLLTDGDGPSGAVTYRHSRSDFVHVTQRGRSSSHLTRLLRQVRLPWSASATVRPHRRMSFSVLWRGSTCAGVNTQGVEASLPASCCPQTSRT
jgi:hypothetical protein